MLFNVIIDYHKKKEAKGGSRRPHGGARAKDGLAYEHARSYAQSYEALTKIEKKSRANGGVLYERTSSYARSYDTCD